MRFNAIQDTPISVGDLVDVYVRMNGAKRVKWSSPPPVLYFGPSSWTVVVPAQNGGTIKAATESIRPSISDDILASLIRSENDEL